MKDLSKSSFLFDLVDEFEIFSSTGTVNSLTDDAYNLFCKKYKALSIQRDQSLFQYLTSTPSLFRCHLPHSKWALAVTFNVFWYYDELILSDPVLQLINSDITDFERRKYYLQDLLSLLRSCKESIDAGYILFSGNDMIPGKTGQFENESKLLVEMPQVLEAFEQISPMVKKSSPLNENASDNLTQIEIFYEGLWGETRKMGMYLPPHIRNSGKLANGVYYDFTRPFERLTKEELIHFGKLDMLVSLKDEYSKDISIVLETITAAQRLNSPILFYRDADCIAAKNYALTHSKSGADLIADTTVFDCLIPYLDGIPVDRLADVRSQIPEAFKDFRAFLFELVKKTMKSTDDPVEIKFKIDYELNSLKKKLTAEMSAAQRKWNFHGLAAPIILLTGSLGLFSSGIDYSKLLSTLMGSGGLIKSLTTWSDVISDKDKARLNPVYFLWKAQNQ